jgi:hypothetical protein
MKNKFYIYLHIKLDIGEPFYIGKGVGDRAYRKGNRNRFWGNIVNKYGFDVVLLEEDLTEQEAFDREIYWIKRIGRKDLNQGPLVNMTDGGEGGSTGRIWSEITRKKMSDSQKKLSETRTPTFLGKTHNEETRKKMSKAKKDYVPWNKGKKLKPLSEEHKLKISNSSKGRIITDETRKKMSEANKKQK